MKIAEMPAGYVGKQVWLRYAFNTRSLAVTGTLRSIHAYTEMIDVPSPGDNTCLQVPGRVTIDVMIDRIALLDLPEDTYVELV